MVEFFFLLSVKSFYRQAFEKFSFWSLTKIACLELYMLNDFLLFTSEKLNIVFQVLKLLFLKTTVNIVVVDKQFFDYIHLVLI